MIVVLIITFSFLACATVSTSILNLTSSIRSKQALNITDALILLDHLRLDNEVANLGFDAHCNGPESGAGLTKEACQDAVTNGIPRQSATSMITYGDRSVGEFDVNLPQRYVSGQ